MPTTSPDPRPEDISVAPSGDMIAVDPALGIAVPEHVALVGTDLDGTLLRSDLGISEFTIGALAGVRAAGVEVVFVTGRPPRWLIPVARLTGHTGLAVCANGALLVDLGEQRLLRKDPIPKALAREVVTWMRRELPGINFAIERVADGAQEARDLAALTTVGYEPGYDSPWARMADVDRADVMELIEQGATVKLLGAPHAEQGLDADALLALVAEQFGHTLHLTHSGTRNVLIEIMSGSIDKGVGLAEVAQLRGVDRSHTVAVGDMPNDLPMLAWAGTGYAVANAHPRVRELADHIIPGNDADGVGWLLHSILEQDS